jgi:hypothetical protein
MYSDGHAIMAAQRAARLAEKKRKPEHARGLPIINPRVPTERKKRMIYPHDFPREQVARGDSHGFVVDYTEGM